MDSPAVFQTLQKGAELREYRNDVAGVGLAPVERNVAGLEIDVIAQEIGAFGVCPMGDGQGEQLAEHDEVGAEGCLAHSCLLLGKPDFELGEGHVPDRHVNSMFPGVLKGIEN